MYLSSVTIADVVEKRVIGTSILAHGERSGDGAAFAAE